MGIAKTPLAVLAGLAFGISLVLPTWAFGQAPFYQGKTITIIQAREAGGTGDLRVRAQVPFLRKYIPGNPVIVVEFMGGGGGRRAANHVYRTSAPDGLTIGAMTPGFVPSAVLGEAGVLYDLDKTIYLGSPDGAAQWVFGTRRQVGASNLEKLRSLPGLRIGAQAVGHPIYLTGRLFAYLLGLKEAKFVTGYTTQELDIALLRGEVDGRSNLAETVVLRNFEWIEKGLALGPRLSYGIIPQGAIIMKKYKKIPHVGSVMTPFPHFADADAGIAEVERLMDEHHIRHIPVQQDGRVVGIVSERDLHHLVDRFLPKTDKVRIRARDIMVDPYVVAFDMPLNEVALEMAKRHIGSAIVLHHEKLAGILSATDICLILAEIFDSEFSPSTGDDAA